MLLAVKLGHKAQMFHLWERPVEVHATQVEELASL